MKWKVSSFVWIPGGEECFGSKNIFLFFFLFLEYSANLRAQEEDHYDAPDNPGFGDDFNDWSRHDEMGAEDEVLNNTEILWKKMLFVDDTGEVIEDPDVPTEVDDAGHALGSEEENSSEDDNLNDLEREYFHPYPKEGELKGRPFPEK